MALLKKVGNDHLGVCLDLGNNIALLEDPMEVVETLAPLAFTTHVKDMGVEESAERFSAGRGATRNGRPRFAPDDQGTTRRSTRSPPHDRDDHARSALNSMPDGVVLVTLEDLPARYLARTLKWVRDHPPARPLDRISRLIPEAQLEREDQNIRLCIEYASKQNQSL